MLKSPILSNSVKINARFYCEVNNFVKVVNLQMSTTAFAIFSLILKKNDRGIQFKYDTGVHW